MLFLAVLIAAIAVFFIQKRLFAASVDERIKYSICFSSFEVYEKTEFFMYETIVNDSISSLPDLKVTTTLDDGLKICYYDIVRSGHRDSYVDRKRSSLVSIFTMKPKLKIERRRRIYAEKRGIYSIDDVMMTVRDITGLYKNTFRYDLPVNSDNTVAVLPVPIELDRFFASTLWQNGSVSVVHSLLSDPLDIAGIREYTENDPLSKINWKATARTSRLMVNNEEHTEKKRFNIILNIQSREHEIPGKEPEALNYIELGIKICASLFDLIGPENSPVRFFTNAPHIPDYCDELPELEEAPTESRDFIGRGDTVNALRMLAELKNYITCEFSSVLDHAGDSDRGCGTNVIVSSYINDTMIAFAEKMRSKKVRTVFFLTSLVRSVSEIPPGIEVFYRLHTAPEGKGGDIS
ncbi:MAG: DUF58 domain-containing protein [Clostridia bacterium]|nr:DUF58 domain-containing protein [Clostridia bacterium]